MQEPSVSRDTTWAEADPRVQQGEAEGDPRVQQKKTGGGEFGTSDTRS